MTEKSTRSLDDPRWKFLHGVFLSNSIRDAIVTRTGRPVYAGKPTVTQSADLRHSIAICLYEIAKSYTVSVDESRHVGNIGRLQGQITARCGGFLNEHHITFGVAQKLLNSYLKYLWCDCLISAPPHCPFDSIIIGRLKLPSNCEWRWPRGTIEDYGKWVEAAREKSAGEPLCEWELREWESAVAKASIARGSATPAALQVDLLGSVAQQEAALPAVPQPTEG